MHICLTGIWLALIIKDIILIIKIIIIMKKPLHSLCYLIALFFLFTACNKKEWNETYDRPDWLADPMYQQLEARQNFTSFLKVVDKADYKDILSKAGYWTLFAPNDEAFQVFLQEQGLSGVDDIDEDLAKSIVKYALVYNAYRKDQLSSYQVGGGALPGLAYKRKTAYYDFVKDGPGGNIKKIIDNNSNTAIYLPNNNNYKYIPYFLDEFMNMRNVTAEDYNFFYPNTPYSGFNVSDASVVNADILAENGIIHEIDRVILPLPSIDTYLASKPQYSYFKELLDEFLVRYESNADVTHRYSVLSDSQDSVYVKIYDAALAFSLNNENHIDNTTSPQTDGYSLAVPTNEVLKDYIHGANGILAQFGTFDKAPTAVLVDLINAHMWGESLWPSKFNTVYNAHQELATFDVSNILDKKLASNGIFYGINQVQDANVFRTVYSKSYLDPKYMLMSRAIDGVGIKFSMINPLLKYTIFMMSDQQIRDGGYDFNTDNNSWTYTVNGVTSSGTVPQNRLYRIVQTSVIQQDISSLAGEGILEAFNEEYVKYKNNKIYAAGNEDNGTEVTIDSVKATVNGTVYYTKGLLEFTENEIGFHLEKLAVNNPNNFSHFYNYLLNSVARYNPTTQQIAGTTTGSFYTLFVPTNAAIEQAVMDGLLPGDRTTGVPDFTSGDGLAVDQVNSLIHYHILDKRTVALNNRRDDPLAVVTLQKTDDGEPTYLQVTKNSGSLSVRDGGGNNVSVILENSNNLSNRTLIHSIGRVLTNGN